MSYRRYDFHGTRQMGIDILTIAIILTIKTEDRSFQNRYISFRFYTNIHQGEERLLFNL